MKLESAIKKLEKAGFEIMVNEKFYTAKKPGHDDVKFLSNDKVKAQNFNTGGVFVKNLTAAIQISKK